MYLNGAGLPKDFVSAYMWFNLAAAQGSDTGKENRNLAEKLMTAEQIADAQKLSREWKPNK
jgi:TPR repeat protein